MALITYDDKDKSLPTSNVRRLFRDVDANEVKDVVNENAEALPTREFGRAFSSELLFDKDYIEGELHVQDDDITFTVSEAGNLINKESIFGQRITTDGVHPIYFLGFNHVANIESGEILEAGTYQFIFWYSNGIARASIMLPSEEVVNLDPLSVPANFEAVPGVGDPDTQVDLSWDAVLNVSSYEIDVSTAGGGGPWTSVAEPAAGDTSYTHGGRSASTTYHYRIRAIGDQIAFSNSQYVITAVTTESAGDVTDPTFISSPADAAVDVVVNQAVVITADEALIDADGVTVITNANILDYLTAVNSSAGAQTITATIDATKKIITITPNVVWDELEDITITLDGIADLNGNTPPPFVITFTTSDYTYMVGNRLSLGNQIDTVILGADKNWEVEAEYGELLLLAGNRGLFQQYESATNQIAFLIYADSNDVHFSYYRAIGASYAKVGVVWPNALSGFTAGKLTFKYFGAIDTNAGLDRVAFYIDDVLITAGKTIDDAQGTFPFDIRDPVTSDFRLSGPLARQVKNFKVRTAMGATTVVDIPIVRTGIDISGNDNHGTWS